MLGCFQLGWENVVRTNRWVIIYAWLLLHSQVIKQPIIGLLKTVCVTNESPADPLDRHQRAPSPEYWLSLSTEAKLWCFFVTSTRWRFLRLNMPTGQHRSSAFCLLSFCQRPWHSQKCTNIVCFKVGHMLALSYAPAN